jgi:PIN domain nuclease of toxin-antitoxin system
MLWWLRDDARLSILARQILIDGSNEILWSLASSWEIAVKLSLGKLRFDRPLHRFFADLVTEHGVEVLPIDHRHCLRLADLPMHHRDPFDRMLIVQGQEASVPLLSADPKFRAYDIKVLW